MLRQIWLKFSEHGAFYTAVLLCLGAGIALLMPTQTVEVYLLRLGVEGLLVKMVLPLMLSLGVFAGILYDLSPQRFKVYFRYAFEALGGVSFGCVLLWLEMLVLTRV